MRRLRRIGVATLGVVTLALALPPAPVAASARAATGGPGRLAAPVVRGASDPATRILELTDLVNRRQESLDAATAAKQRIAARLIEARRLETYALAKTDELSLIAQAAETEYRQARKDAAAMAAAMYRSAGSAPTLLKLLDSESPAELSYRRRIVDRATDVQLAIVKRAVTTRREALRAEQEAVAARRHWQAEVRRLQEELPARDAEIDRIGSRLGNARFWLRRWQSIAAGVDTPIMSRSVLGPSELARWFHGTGRRARITVPFLELARYYIEEGEAAGVRGDIAFMQSVLETGGFYFPDGGQLNPTDNNFAGMDACDSCAHGRAFPDARTGVRAQVQQLRVYADPNLTNSQLNPPPVIANLDQHHLKGEVPTWNGLTHTWATADTYGDRIISLYAGMLAWLTDRADI